jgi:hypothetical protein
MEKKPASQLVQPVAPLALALPAAQAMQAAGADAYVPAGQEVAAKAQDVAPAVLYVPAAHATGEAAPVGQEKPAGHAAVVIV